MSDHLSAEAFARTRMLGLLPKPLPGERRNYHGTLVYAVGTCCKRCEAGRKDFKEHLI